MRVGIDIDGVLADFNSTFIDRVVTVTGKDLFPSRPFDIPTWNYPEHYGYARDEVSAVWESIKTDPCFWQSLLPYETTARDLETLHRGWQFHGDELYFITARPGVAAKRQTEEWLRQYWPKYIVPPLTVLISSHKGLCAAALDLDIYVDDRWENALDVRTAAPKCKVFLVDRPWNRDYPHLLTTFRIAQTSSVADALEYVWGGFRGDSAPQDVVTDSRAA